VQGMLLAVHFKVCHEKHGWLAPGTLEKVRKLIDEKGNEAVIKKFGELFIKSLK